MCCPRGQHIVLYESEIAGSLYEGKAMQFRKHLLSWEMVRQGLVPNGYFRRVITVISLGQNKRMGSVQPMPELTYSDCCMGEKRDSGVGVVCTS